MSNSLFEIFNVELSYISSNELNDARSQSKSIKNRILNMKVMCNTCAHQWLSTEGQQHGMFRKTLSAIFLKCPKCNADGELSLSTLNV